MAQPCYATSDCSQICLNMHTQRWCEIAVDLVAREERRFLIVLFLLSLLPLLFTFHLFPLPPPLSFSLPTLLSSPLHSQQCCGAWCRKQRCHIAGNFTGTDPPRLSLQNCSWVRQHTHTTSTQHIMLSHPPTHTPIPSQVSLNSFSGNGWMVATLSA